MDFEDDDFGVDLTPLIDIIFMLVIFFIMTMSFALPALKLNLPSSSTAAAAALDPKHHIVVNAGADGSLKLNGKDTSLKAIGEKLQADPQAVLVLNTEAQTSAQIIVDLADLASEYAGGRMLITVKPKAQ